MLDELERLSADLGRLRSLIELSAYMSGRINCENLPDNEQIRESYPFWLELLLDTVTELATTKEQELDKIMKNIYATTIKG